MVSEKTKKYKTEWMRNWRKKNPTKARIAGRKSAEIYKQRNPEKVKQQVTKAVANWRKNNPEKNKAHRIVYNALRNGTLEKQLCEECGEKKAHAHHDDYNKPLEVRWLCTKHHGIRHLLENKKLPTA